MNALLILFAIFFFFIFLFCVPFLRRHLISRFVMIFFSKVMPKMGDTERIALEAGTVWWDRELFSGKPNWKKLLDFKMQELSQKEKSFIEGPVQELCKMLDDWKVIQDRNLPSEVWGFIKKTKFLGMIIPESYGGLGFSAFAHAQVITMLSSRCITAAVTVMVPNSLGPAELLLRYGTDAQKNFYLPRLARGEELPCFALTEPDAGSDAAAAHSHGVVCRGIYDGKDVLGMRLNWKKRYITLGPVSTILGLAFHLHDPNQLLGQQKNIGITCALIPSHLPGITIGQRHDPMGVPFQNGPNEGENVFVPLDFIIGGSKMAGKGWKMLMESLGAGRGISLPSLSVGAAQFCTRVVGAYVTVREQFGTAIGNFEGIEEELARIGGTTYWMTATRRLTLGALDAGERPSVLTAIVKAYLTEGMRKVVDDTMDIRAGSGIMQGPHNLIGNIYKAVPIAITVEGANILTRSMIIYGQGAIRCHPFIQKELKAVDDKNLKAFDQAFWGHIGFVFSNMVRAPILGLSGGCDLKKLTRLSTAFVLMSDFAMITLGGSLKRHESISGRLADALSWMYIASATLKKFHDEGELSRDKNLLRWSIDHAFYEIQNALAGVLDNLPNRPAAWFLKPLIFPLGKRFKQPTDNIGFSIAHSLVNDREGRETLTRDVYIPNHDEIGLGKLEDALDKIVKTIPIKAKIRDAIHSGKLKKSSEDLLLQQAFEIGVINRQELEQMKQAKKMQEEVIQVDAFDPKIFSLMRD